MYRVTLYTSECVEDLEWACSTSACELEVYFSTPQCESKPITHGSSLVKLLLKT